MSPKVKTQIDGKPVEIEVTDEDVTAAGFMPKDSFEKELGRRGVGIAKSQGYVKPDELTPEQVKALAEQKGIKFETPDPSETVTAVQDAVKKNRETWENTELNPTKAKLTEAEQEVEDLLQSKLHSDIISAAAAAGIDVSLLRAPTKNSLPPIVNMLASAFGFDTDTKQFLVLSDDGTGFAFSDRPTQDHPYKDVTEMVESWAANKDNQKFLAPGQRGPNLQNTTSGRPGAGPVHLTRAQSRDARAVQAAVAEATRRGLDPHNGGVVYDN